MQGMQGFKRIAQVFISILFSLFFMSAVAYGSPIEGSTTVTSQSDHTLYARWRAISYSVTYYANGSTATAPTDNNEYNHGNAANVLDGIGRDGYTFGGWNTEPDGQGIDYQPGDIITIYDNINLYAQWDAEGFTISYYGNGGTAPIDSNIYAYGDILIVLEGIFREGYEFNGWNTEPSGIGTTYQAGEALTINGNISLYAQWTEKPTSSDLFAVTYYSDGEAAPSDNNMYSSGDTATILPAAYREGYDFIGWNTTANGTGITYQAHDTLTISGNVSLYAQWTLQQVTPSDMTVYFDSNGGTGLSFANKVVTYGNQYGALPVADRDGYTFAGWFTEASGGQFVSNATLVPINYDHTLYAQWTSRSDITVIFNSNGGNTPSFTNKTVIYGLAYGGLPDVDKDGYTFAGWFSASSGGMLVTSATVVDNISDHILYAQWISRNNINVKFNPNGGNTSFTNKDVSYGNAYGNLPSATREGHSFSGWYTVPTGGSLVSSATIVTNAENHTLYAQWQMEFATSVTVTYEYYKDSVDANNFLGEYTAIPIHLETNWNDYMNLYKPSGDYLDGTIVTLGADVIRVVYEPAAKAEPMAPLKVAVIEEHVAYISGYPDGTVRPGGNISRAEAATIFFSIIGANDKYKSLPNLFSDVPYDAWYGQAVRYLTGIGIMSGYQDGTFLPEQPMTRAEFTTVAAKFYEMDANDALTFYDVPSGHWASSYINLAYSRGLLVGFGDNQFRPDEYIPRAEVVTIINKMLNRDIKTENLPNEVNPYMDLEASHWAYADILEASIPHKYERINGEEFWTEYTR